MGFWKVSQQKTAPHSPCDVVFPDVKMFLAPKMYSIFFVKIPVTRMAGGIHQKLNGTESQRTPK